MPPLEMMQHTNIVSEACNHQWIRLLCPGLTNLQRLAQCLPSAVQVLFPPKAGDFSVHLDVLGNATRHFVDALASRTGVFEFKCLHDAIEELPGACLVLAKIGSSNARTRERFE